ncbi:DNA-3-methyladenine glycosylase family protein [Exiguobacterium acetylicum]|uniref:DNA-3-methyladenine glycosylase family protein n=1 Tax=Exiguobacterium acetylicum TaxID=41170 RepID=UPI001EE1C572|nr:DNA-3-methyladenine glycosylase 2 family protein [Exiguobacterium acetylicum]UKS57085.1 DNA-3-methyladenine glycosylase 2 family protein [Exiguobacterium acetylicum]
MSRWTYDLALSEAFDFKGIVSRLTEDPLQVERAGRLVVPVFINEQAYLATIEAMDAWTLRVDGTGPKETILAQLKRRFRLSEPNPAKRLKATSLHAIVERFGDERLVLDHSPFTALIRSIIHQQINLSFAHTLTERVFRTFGTVQDGIILPPIPRQLAVANREDLLALQLSGRKVDYLLGVAKADIDYEALAAATDAEIAETLIALKGVGPWTVQNVLMFGYGRPDLFPASDIGILRAFERLLGYRPSVEEATRLAEEFAPVRSHAAYLLWRSIE